jgi:hypothetical protein
MASWRATAALLVLAGAGAASASPDGEEWVDPVDQALE